MSKLKILGLSILGYKVAMNFTFAKDVRNLIRGVKQQFPELKYIPENLVVAISKVESDHNPNATGDAGEYGYMQILPSTWDFIWQDRNIAKPENPYDPFYNIMGGMLYLDRNYKQLRSWFATIHSYNRGLAGYLQGRRNWTYFNKVFAWWIAS